MKAHLMSPHRDFDPDRKPPGNAADLIQDLELATLWDAMARGDDLLLQFARAATLESVTDVDEIRYRQEVLEDCLHHADVVRELYALATEAVTAERTVARGLFTNRPQPLLSRSVRVLDLLVDIMRRVQRFATEHAGEFRSTGLRELCGTLRAELADDYLDELGAHLHQLNFGAGMVVSARLGAGNKGIDYVLREPRPENRTFFRHLALKKPTWNYTIPDRDEAGFRALGELQDRALNDVANAVAQSADHVRDFFAALRAELGFYLGCVNLAETLADIGIPFCFPEPCAPERHSLSAAQLREPCLGLRTRAPVVGSDIDADRDGLILITGANQGGKSTFLRGLGIAQLMMQCGMFVAAQQFTGAVVTGIFTHYRREEDASMESGKLDEELARMSGIADHIDRHALLLCNESFAATNEREGSDIAAEVTRAMLDASVRVAFVTHLYDLAHTLYEERGDTSLFLRAERQESGERSFRLDVGEPLPTSYGADLYKKIFGADVGR